MSSSVTVTEVQERAKRGEGKRACFDWLSTNGFKVTGFLNKLG
jgi:hypothetical protein